MGAEFSKLALLNMMKICEVGRESHSQFKFKGNICFEGGVEKVELRRPELSALPSRPVPARHFRQIFGVFRDVKT